MKNTILYFALSLVLLISLDSCLIEPKFPLLPKITFKNLKYVDEERDSLITTISFEDGDGNLGLNQSDTLGIFNEFKDTTINGTTTRITNHQFFNFFMDLYIKESSGNFQKYIFPGGTSTFNSRFPRLIAEGLPAKPIEGDIVISSTITAGLSQIISGKTIKFAVRIQDRTLPQPFSSNVIETDTLVIPKKK